MHRRLRSQGNVGCKIWYDQLLKATDVLRRQVAPFRPFKHLPSGAHLQVDDAYGRRHLDAPRIALTSPAGDRRRHATGTKLPSNRSSGALESLMDCRSPRGVAFVAHASPSSGHGILPTVSTVRQQQRKATCTLLQSTTPTDRGRRNGVMPWSTPSRPIAPRRCRTHRLQAAFAVVRRSFCSQGPGFVSVHRNLFSLALRSAQEHPLHRRGRTLSRSRCPAISSAHDGN
jgi:hypothetical protein